MNKKIKNERKKRKGTKAGTKKKKKANALPAYPSSRW